MRRGTIVLVDAVATIMSDPTLLNRLAQCMVPSAVSRAAKTSAAR